MWIGIATVLSVVLLTCFMEIGTPGATTFSSFSDNVIWNNFSLIFPATIVLIAGYIIERERTGDTLKNLAAIPVSFKRLLVGKIIVCGIIAIFLAIIEFLFTAIISFILGYGEITFFIMIKALLQMVGMNCFVFIAVSPYYYIHRATSRCIYAGCGFCIFLWIYRNFCVLP